MFLMRIMLTLPAWVKIGVPYKNNTRFTRVSTSRKREVKSELLANFSKPFSYVLTWSAFYILSWPTTH